MAAEKAYWWIVRLMSGSVEDETETVDAELDLDDFQFWFRRNPDHPEYMQALVNFSGNDWDKIKNLPMVVDRTAKE